jgi:DNA polymerase-3 subunit chi
LTQIDFYLLPSQSEGQRLNFACRLAEKAWTQGHRVLIQTPSAAESEQLNRLLWTFREGSFLPHGLLAEADTELTPILINHGEEAGEEHQVLINLSPAIPAFFSRFERLAEILDQTPDILAAGRSRYGHYQERGYPLQHHQM